VKRTIIMAAGLAGTLAMTAGRAHADPMSPQGANVYRTSLGGGFFGSSGEPGGGNELLLAGGITLGAGYAGSVLGGLLALALVDYNAIRPDLTLQEDGYGAKQATKKMFIPIVGPWKALSENLDALDRCHREALTCADGAYWAGNVGYIVGGAAQAVGIGLMVYGLIARDNSKPGEPPREGIMLSAGPIPGGGVVVVGGGF
jgi:hypothetical protein